MCMTPHGQYQDCRDTALSLTLLGLETRKLAPRKGIPFKFNVTAAIS